MPCVQSAAPDATMTKPRTLFLEKLKDFTRRCTLLDILKDNVEAAKNGHELVAVACGYGCSLINLIPGHVKSPLGEVLAVTQHSSRAPTSEEFAGQREYNTEENNAVVTGYISIDTRGREVRSEVF